MKYSGFSPITMEDGWFAGEDQAGQWTIVDTAGAAVNITGWSIQFKMANTADGAAVVTRTATLTTPSSGICTVVCESAATFGLDAGTYHYTLRRIDSGFNSVLAYGTLVLQKGPS